MSGHGRELGQVGLRNYTEIKTVSLFWMTKYYIAEEIWLHSL